MRSKVLSKLKFTAIRKDKDTLKSVVLDLLLLLLMVYPLLQPHRAEAVVSKEAFVRFDRLSTGAAISGTACMKTNTSGTESGVIIDFPTGWTISGTASNWTTTTSNLPTDPDGGGTATAWPSIGTATSVTGLSVRFPSGDLSTATWYCFNFAGASSTVGSAGNDQTGQLKTQGGSPFVDNFGYATSVVASNADQITVTASVSATMTFSLNSNSVSLGALSTSSVTSGTAVTQSVSTNGRNGWTSWIKSANAALSSSLSGGSITSPGSQDGTPEDLSAQAGYVVDTDLNSCSGCTIAGEYDGNTTNKGGHLSTTFQQTATQTAPASANTVNYVVRAKMSSTTPAASDYTDTLTVTAAGSF